MSKSSRTTARSVLKVREIVIECLESDHFNTDVYDRAEEKLLALEISKRRCEDILTMVMTVYDWNKQRDITQWHDGVQEGMNRIIACLPKSFVLNNRQELDMSSKKVDVRGQGNIVNVADYIKDVANYVNQTVSKSNEGDEAKSLVNQLGEQLQVIAEKIDETKAKEMGRDLKSLSDEMASPVPRRKWYQLSIDGLKEAAQAVGDVGKPILESAIKLGSILLGS